jgi:hypothetical protein
VLFARRDLRMSLFSSADLQTFAELEMDAFAYLYYCLSFLLISSMEIAGKLCFLLFLFFARFLVNSLAQRAQSAR